MVWSVKGKFNELNHFYYNLGITYELIPQKRSHTFRFIIFYHIYKLCPAQGTTPKIYQSITRTAPRHVQRVTARQHSSSK